MSVAGGRPPQLSNQDAAAIIRKHFNFKNVDELSIKAFPSYRDRNYYFQGEHTDKSNYEFVFKLSNPLSTTFDVMEGVNGVMKHLSTHSLLSPYPLPSHTGKDLIELSSAQLLSQESGDHDDDEKKMKYPIYVLSFIPGLIFDHVDKKFLTPSLLHEVGELLGKMDKELMDNFSNKALATRKNPDWDLMTFLDMKSYLKDLDDASHIANGAKIFKAFEEYVSPKIPSLRKRIIHGDLNGLNIVLKEKLSSDNAYHIAGFIDFNDCIMTCGIFELGISLAYIMQENLTPVLCSDAVEFVGPLISAYNSVLPLSADELDCLYYLVLARCCQTALNGTRAHKVEPWNSYLLTTPKKSWVLVDQLLSTPKSYVDGTWKNFLNV